MADASVGIENAFNRMRLQAICKMSYVLNEVPELDSLSMRTLQRLVNFEVNDNYIAS